MKRYFLKTNSSDTYAIIRKIANIDENDFSYTESGNDITINQYIGSEQNVKIANIDINMYSFARPTVYKLNIDDYTYTNDDGVVTLTKYTGSGGNIDTPEIIEG